MMKVLVSVAGMLLPVCVCECVRHVCACMCVCVSV